MFGFRVDELIEVTPCAARGLFLVDEFESVLVEFVKELVPGDLFQVFIILIARFGKAEAENSGLAVPVSAANFGGHCAARFRPLANGVVILGCSGKWHC